MENGYKPCPYCAEPIRIEAKYCKHCQRNLPQPTPAWRWALLGILGAAVISLFFYNLGRAPEGVRENKKAVAPAPPSLVPVAKSIPIVNGNVVVNPQEIQYYKFVVPQVAQGSKVSGVFHAFGGWGDDIEVVILTPFEFENWRNGHQARTYYNSGKVTNGEIEVDGIPPGLYILAFSNRAALFSRKEVTAQVSLTYTVLEQQ